MNDHHQPPQPSDRVYLLAKAPHWTFVWWELTPAGLADASRIAGPGGRLALRVREVAAACPPADAAREVWETAIAGETDHWYLPVPASGCTYQVQIGIQSDGGDFHAIAESKPASVPPEGPSSCLEGSWSTVPIRRRRWTLKATS